MDKEISIHASRGDTEQVLNLFSVSSYATPRHTISRRTFCTYSSLALASLLLPSCSVSDTNTSLKILSKEEGFMQFFDIIFPAEALGLNKYKTHALSRIQRITGELAQEVAQTYNRFKGLLWQKSDLGTKDYNRAIGEQCMIDLLHSKHAEQCNLALDIIYLELSKERKMIAALWGRPYSLTDKKCVYWDTYDQAVS